jgi:hypothetical protein
METDAANDLTRVGIAMTAVSGVVLAPGLLGKGRLAPVQDWLRAILKALRHRVSEFANPPHELGVVQFQDFGDDVDYIEDDEEGKWYARASLLLASFFVVPIAMFYVAIIAGPIVVVHFAFGVTWLWALLAALPGVLFLSLWGGLYLVLYLALRCVGLVVALLAAHVTVAITTVILAWLTKHPVLAGVVTAIGWILFVAGNSLQFVGTY